MIITARNVHSIESPNRDSPGPTKTRRNTGSDARQTPNALLQLDVTQRRTGNPGGEKAKPSSTQPLESCRTPSCEYAKPCKPARNNTGHEMCDLARDMNRAMRVAENKHQ